MSKNELQKQSAPMQIRDGNLQLQTIDDLWRLAKMFCASGLCPDNLNTPEKVSVVLQGGAELGFKPWQSLQVLHVVNGRLGMEGSAMLAKIRKSGVCEYVTMHLEGTPYEDNYRAVVKSKRKADSAEYVTDFSVDDAKRAKLWDAKDNWKKYPKDMLTWRAVSRHARRYYTDEIWAMYTPDELEEIESVPLTFGEASEQSQKQIEAQTGTRRVDVKMSDAEPAETPGDDEEFMEGADDPDTKAEAEKQKADLAAAEAGKREGEKVWECKSCYVVTATGKSIAQPKRHYRFAEPVLLGKKDNLKESCPQCFCSNIENHAVFEGDPEDPQDSE